ncbi:hypothetical protein DXC69_03080 [Paenibacillus polymyxa]|nr:hypothetical protein DXC69_03080 [Paenibacillus polymyxa]
MEAGRRKLKLKKSNSNVMVYWRKLIILKNVGDLSLRTLYRNTENWICYMFWMSYQLMVGNFLLLRRAIHFKNCRVC